MAKVDILIPTINRPSALIATLTSLCFQTHRDFRVVIANQGDRQDLDKNRSLQCVMQLLILHGHMVEMLDNLPLQGVAQQRHFLLGQVSAPYCLFLDDDILLEPFVLRNLLYVLERHACGFAGSAPIGLSYVAEYRPDAEAVEFWKESVKPESVTPDSAAWRRHRLHDAANVLHVQQKLHASAEKPRPYKVAWVGGCVLYDTSKLRSAGGFGFWRELPRQHCGEDVLAQLRVMKRYGGCGVLPSGAYHQELPTTVLDRKVDAPLWLGV